LAARKEQPKTSNQTRSVPSVSDEGEQRNDEADG
jgi:hypothetical protein